MSLFLVSFPNQLTSASCSLIAIDLQHKKATWLRLENYVPDIGGGVCGICFVPGGLAICTQSVAPAIVLLHPTTLEVVHVFALKEVKDPHSVTYRDGHLYVVSTGTNEIYRLKVDDLRLYGEELFWRFPHSSSHIDQVHLNGITVSYNMLIATAFGPKDDDKWGSNGSVFYPETGEIIAEGLRQPHTPVCFEGILLFAESSTGGVSVFERKGKSKWNHTGRVQTGGYPRGIAFSNERLYIGVSSTRNVSKSQGIMLGEQDLSSRAGIMCLTFPELSIESKFDLSPFAREIYDIVPLKNGITLDSFFKALSDRAREMQNSGERSADHLARLQATLSNAACEHLKIEAEKQQLEAEKRQLEAQKQQLEAEKQQLISEKEIMEDQLGTVLNSRSWRFTAPVRFVGRKCKQFLEK